MHKMIQYIKTFKGINDMYSNCGYLNNSEKAFVDEQHPLVISACGTYRLNTLPEFPTIRPNGRIDYQLVYIASGSAHFVFDGKEHILSAGNMILYRPKEPQEYIYYIEEHPEVYWVHFTGTEVDAILQKYDLLSRGPILHTGTSPSYERFFRQMIQELQLCRPYYESTLTLQFQELLISIRRHIDTHKQMNAFARKEVEYAIHYFNENYNKDINIEEYAASRHMSISWFIRNFKRYCKMTPLNYIVSIRISNAKNLLENTSYNITEIATIVGYDNPLYFSRLFHKHEGIAPSEYRNKLIHL